MFDKSLRNHFCLQNVRGNQNESTVFVIKTVKTKY